jgi:hypothetical protein
MVFYHSRPFFGPICLKPTMDFGYCCTAWKDASFRVNTSVLKYSQSSEKFTTRYPTTGYFLLVSNSVFSQQINHISAPSRSFWAGLVSFDRASKTATEALPQPRFVFLFLAIESKYRTNDDVKSTSMTCFWLLAVLALSVWELWLQLESAEVILHLLR